MKSTCPHPECDKEVLSDQFACRVHWFSLPADLRRRIWQNYRSGEVGRIMDGYAEAAEVWDSRRG